MQIQNLTLAQSNYSQKRNPNFTAIKSVKCEGLYKKYPELANDLVTAFKNNPKAMEFCKKYDVDIIFYAVKGVVQDVETSIHILFDNAAKSKFKKFLDKLGGSREDKINLFTWGKEYELPRSMKKGTEDLIEIISPEKKTAGGYRGGLLDSYLESADERIQIALNKKLGMIEEKNAKIEASKAAKSKLDSDTSKLQNSIKELMDESSYKVSNINNYLE